MSQAARQTLPVVAFLIAGMLAYIILRSRWHGWKLAAVTVFIFYGVYTFMSQIETVVFPAAQAGFPEGTLRGLFLMGLVMTIPFALIAVPVLGKWRKAPASDEPNQRLHLPAAEWGWKMAIIVLMYEALYFLFGYYIAWQSEAVRAYYGGVDPGSFLGQMGNVMRDTPWLPFYQILRALLWMLIALPVIRMLKGAGWEAALAVALLFSIGMSAQLLFPSPYMPEDVRLAHLLETASSNFIFGFLLTTLLLWRPASVRARSLTPNSALR